MRSYRLQSWPLSPTCSDARNHAEANGWTWRSLHKSSFTGQAVSFRDFDAIVSAWVACGLVERVAGFKETVEFDPGDKIRLRGKASRFRATAKLLAICADCGITPQNATENFAYAPPEHPLRLNASSKNRSAMEGARKADQLRADG